MSPLSHFDESGASRMVDVGAKAETNRVARASAVVRMRPATLALIRNKEVSKGDVLEVARLAGIMAAKKTSDLIPLCHPLPLTSVKLDFRFTDDGALRIERARGHEFVPRIIEALPAGSVESISVGRPTLEDVFVLLTGHRFQAGR